MTPPIPEPIPFLRIKSQIVGRLGKAFRYIPIHAGAKAEVKLFLIKNFLFLSRKKVCGQESYSQAGQDLFILHTLQRKRGGVYLEIGSQSPIFDSNTFLLERDFDWKGASLELRREPVREFNAIRRNPCIEADAVSFDYETLLDDDYFPRQIDYLQVDIDPPENTLKALKKLPHHKYRFSIITFEHDKARSGPKIMEESREFLRALGYCIAVGNVVFEGNDFEDWWIDPSIVPESAYEVFKTSSERKYPDLFKAILEPD